MTRRDDSYKLRDEVKPQVNYTLHAGATPLLSALRGKKNKTDSLPPGAFARRKKVSYLCNKFEGPAANSLSRDGRFVMVALDFLH